MGIFYYNHYMDTVETMVSALPFLDAGPVVLRIIKFIVYLLVAIHVFGCLFITLANLRHEHGNYMLFEGGPQTPLLVNDVFAIPGSDESYAFRKKFRQYYGGVYFSTLLIVGYGVALPQNEADVVYSLFIVVAGTALFATIVGTVVALIEQLGATEQAFQDKMRNIKDYMRFRSVDEKLQKDAFTFFNIVQRSGRGIDQEEIMGDLEMSIKRNISQYLHRSIVSQVPLFQQCGELFIQDICQYLRYTLLLKDYRIVNKGEIGKEMFFIGKGSVEVISEDGSVVFAKLQAGKFFGEVALLSADARRTASIRAAELCEVYVLTKEDFDDVIGRYPDAKRIIQEEIERRKQPPKPAAPTPITAAAPSSNKLKGIVKLGTFAKKGKPKSDGEESS